MHDPWSDLAPVPACRECHEPLTRGTCDGRRHRGRAPVAHRPGCATPGPHQWAPGWWDEDPGPERDTWPDLDEEQPRDAA